MTSTILQSYRVIILLDANPHSARGTFEPHLGWSHQFRLLNFSHQSHVRSSRLLLDLRPRLPPSTLEKPVPPMALRNLPRQRSIPPHRQKIPPPDLEISHRTSQLRRVGRHPPPHPKPTPLLTFTTCNSSQ